MYLIRLNFFLLSIPSTVLVSEQMKVIGVDIGSQKTMMVADDGDIVLVS